MHRPAALSQVAASISPCCPARALARGLSPELYLAKDFTGPREVPTSMILTIGVRVGKSATP